MNTIVGKDEVKKPSLTLSSPELKMFIHKDPNETEIAVNNWLKQNSVKVTHFSQSQSERGGNFMFVFSLVFIRIADNH